MSPGLEGGSQACAGVRTTSLCFVWCLGSVWPRLAGGDGKLEVGTWYSVTTDIGFTSWASSRVLEQEVQSPSNAMFAEGPGAVMGCFGDPDRKHVEAQGKKTTSKTPTYAARTLHCCSPRPALACPIKALFVKKIRATSG